METSRLDYTINILTNFSFDINLFYKEVDKAFKVLLPYEAERLSEWLEYFIEENPELKKCEAQLS